MSNKNMDTFNWSDKVYTLSDLVEKMKLNHCLLKSNEPLCSELDYLEILCIKHIYCVRAFKVSTPADGNIKDDKNNNSDLHTLTSGDEVFIPLHYMGRGTIVPLYGESHVCNTVEELIMTFPRYVLIEENLNICSESKFTQLQAGSELELLRNTKDKNYQDKLICRYGDQTLKLKPSDIGRFRVRPDPNLYSVKDILQRLKLPQIIDFKEILQDQWEKDVNFFEGLSPEQSYTGKFLLTGLFKDKAAVVVALGPNSRPNTQPFILPLSSDLIQQLKFRFTFRGDFSQFKFKGGSNSLTRLDKKEDEKEKNTKKKETKLKRGKSEADLTQSQKIPFELTYTQYRFPESADKSKQGDKIFKKVQSAVKSVKGIFKKATSQDVAAIRDSVLRVTTPEPNRKASTKLYPILANLMNEDSSLYDYIESGTLGKKSGESQSQFYFEIDPPKAASAPSEECLSSAMPVEENIYQNLDDILTEGRNDEETSAVAGDPRNERTENKIKPKTVIESISEAEAYETFPVTDNGNEAEKDSGSLVDEEYEYMNYNAMATLQIRRHSPFKKRATSVSECSSSEEMSQDSNWNAVATDEKSDFSTGEEESYTENSPSVNVNEDDVYEFEVRSSIPEAALPVPPKRNLKLSSQVAIAVECSSDACGDIKTAVSNSNEKQSTQLEDMSVQELCEILHECGLSRISKMCKEHSLDGAFLCALPDDSLQEQPFSLTHLEIMKIAMMKKGWKPKIK